mmetsp:Transcript_16326/g.24706  ORF Transcript_16326/g.24706 Transcript_16326/m.24706 type:complete len:148 (+) Transcript_16326:52-495(+)
MHSRRPPTLRHKGIRRKTKQDQQSNTQDEEDQNDKTKSGAKNGVKTSSSKKSRKSSGFPVRILVLLVFLVVLGFYAKFMISKTLKSTGKNKSGNLRSNGSAMSPEKDNTASSKKDEISGKADNANTKNDENEELAWKNVVKEQSTSK